MGDFARRRRAFGWHPGDAVSLGIFLVIVFVVAAVGGAATASAIDSWYGGLVRPSWNPPAWVFGPVWTVLYVMIAVSGWLVWRDGGIVKQAVPLGLFATQLALNALWSPLFFGLRNPALALVDIVLLDIAVVLCIVAFFRVKPLAAALLVPYLAWGLFATALNAAILVLNT